MCACVCVCTSKHMKLRAAEHNTEQMCRHRRQQPRKQGRPSAAPAGPRNGRPIPSHTPRGAPVPQLCDTLPYHERKMMYSHPEHSHQPSAARSLASAHLFCAHQQRHHMHMPCPALSNAFFHHLTPPPPTLPTTVRARAVP